MNILYPPKWYFETKFLKREKPLQTVLFITNKCNLSCAHCSVYDHKNPIVKDYSQIMDELEYSYGLGSRFVDFEGGEPTLWHDGEHTLNDLVDLAHDLGFYSTTVTTNAQQDFSGLKADSVWVSMDGIYDFHDAVRGKGTFEKLLSNIASSNHKALSDNMVIDANNHVNVKDTLEFVKKNPALRSIAFNFYTPAFGTDNDPLVLPWDIRNSVLDFLIDSKRRGAPIMNSVSGLRRMKDLDFEKVCWMCNYILPDGTKLSECVGKTAGVCDSCGFCMAGEMRSVMSFKIGTILAGLKLRG